MRFSERLSAGTYGPWKDNYVEYDALKLLLKTNEDYPTWEESDESKFVSALDKNLEKVYDFYKKTTDAIDKRVGRIEEEYEQLNSEDSEIDERMLEEFIKRLDAVAAEVVRIEKYTRINLTALYKIVKKHDKLYTAYSLRPLLQTRLHACPIDKANFNPILARIFTLHTQVRDELNSRKGETPAVSTRSAHERTSSKSLSTERHITYRFWVHADNLMEVKTFILRRLPVLYYSKNQRFEKDRDAVSGILDPTSTCLYLDNPGFDLYMQNMERSTKAYSLRLHWYGQLTPKTDIVVERMVREGSSLSHTEDRFVIREKNVHDLLQGTYDPEKKIRKMRDEPMQSGEAVESYKKLTSDVQKLIVDNHLQPVLRSVYTRSAFQIPGDNTVRVNLDSDLVLIREDCIDQDRPCRNPDEWHRHDVDEASFPYKNLRKGEIVRFPHSILEIREKLEPGQDEPGWVKELRNSYLVTEVDGFSKYEHGVGALFENYVSLLPFWFFNMETDIRKDPQSIYEASYPPKSIVGSPKPRINVIKNKSEKSKIPTIALNGQNFPKNTTEEGESSKDRSNPLLSDRFNLKSIPYLLKPSTYGSIQGYRTYETPSHIKKPLVPLRVSGPVRVETKVWLANERTFLKWLHVVVLMASLALGLYNSNTALFGRALGFMYTMLAVCIGFYAWRLHARRCDLIKTRSPEPMTEYWGPLIVGASLMFALLFNMSLAYKEAVFSGFLEREHVLVKLFTNL
ncbi:polyphosphate synthetase [Schizosaccharomyces japonicus yFS275]|uniref:Polyphosphate synthetase n=1 Tax=Schizosaccharomyces japonicus (strain yFS275 / FY16936) TaxID=402676 RepID=B6K489_SCHJY|nr:polyphosphate synthetase [Schizosaccharomyces japonicus yFS275]EEB08296.1 polyphosphate synthetase [Schizosaccharomyces japonicus yFS275]